MKTKQTIKALIIITLISIGLIMSSQAAVMAIVDGQTQYNTNVSYSYSENNGDTILTITNNGDGFITIIGIEMDSLLVEGTAYEMDLNPKNVPGANSIGIFPSKTYQPDKPKNGLWKGDSISFIITPVGGEQFIAHIQGLGENEEGSTSLYGTYNVPEPSTSAMIFLAIPLILKRNR